MGNLLFQIKNSSQASVSAIVSHGQLLIGTIWQFICIHLQCLCWISFAYPCIMLYSLIIDAHTHTYIYIYYLCRFVLMCFVIFERLISNVAQKCWSNPWFHQLPRPRVEHVDQTWSDQGLQISFAQVQHPLMPVIPGMTLNILRWRSTSVGPTVMWKWRKWPWTIFDFMEFVTALPDSMLCMYMYFMLLYVFRV